MRQEFKQLTQDFWINSTLPLTKKKVFGALWRCYQLKHLSADISIKAAKSNSH